MVSRDLDPSTCNGSNRNQEEQVQRQLPASRIEHAVTDSSETVHCLPYVQNDRPILLSRRNSHAQHLLLTPRGHSLMARNCHCRYLKLQLLPKSSYNEYLGMICCPVELKSRISGSAKRSNSRQVSLAWWNPFQFCIRNLYTGDRRRYQIKRKLGNCNKAARTISN